MLISVNKVSNILREVNITVPAVEIADEELKRLKEIAPKVKVKGFRQGKVPFDVVRKQFGKDIRDEVIGKLIRESYTKAIQQENLHPVGVPTVKITSDADAHDADLQYTASIEILPEFEIQGLGEVTVEKPVATLTDADVDNEIEKIKKHYVKWNVADANHAAQNGDKLTINLNIKTLSDNAEKAEEGVEFVLGSTAMWDEFEKPLLGAKVGDDLSFNLTFPITHIEPEFAGKEVNAKVKVLKVLAAEMPTLDEVVKNTGFEEKGGIDALRNHIKAAMSRELKHSLATKFDNNVIDKLLELIPLEVPRSLIEMESKRKYDEMTARLQKMAGIKKMPTLKKEFFEGEATRNVTAGIILSKVIKDNNIEIDDAKLQAKVAEFAEEADSTRKDEIIQMYNQNKNLLANIQNLLIEEEALNFIKQQMQVVEKTLTVAEALQKNN